MSQPILGVLREATESGGQSSPDDVDIQKQKQEQASALEKELIAWAQWAAAPQTQKFLDIVLLAMQESLSFAANMSYHAMPNNDMLRARAVEARVLNNILNIPNKGQYVRE